MSVRKFYGFYLERLFKLSEQNELEEDEHNAIAGWGLDRG